MIFIGGVQPKTTVVDRTGRLCPACGLAQARLKRMDHYFSLFFIPLMRVQKGTEFLFCDRCNRPVSDMSGRSGHEPAGSPDACSACGRALEKDHRFCPYCGQSR